VRGLITRLRADERGFTMVIAIMVLLIVMLLSVGAYTAAGGDIHPGAHSRDQKSAYAAADAGLQWYQAQLASDPSYWSECTDVPVPDGETDAPVNQLEDTGDALGDERHWRQIDGTNQHYTVELIPANGATTCDDTDPAATFIDDDTRSFRIRVSGSAGAPTALCGRAGNPKCPPRRSIVATFRRSSFLDYLYFTDYETYDPALQLQANGYPGGTTSPTDFKTWATTNCGDRTNGGMHWWQGRGNQSVVLNVNHKGTWYNNRTLRCAELAFGNDSVAGPMHTNDSILLAGNAPGTTFGRNAQDAIEIANQATGTYASVRSADLSNPPDGTPDGVATWLGTKDEAAREMKMPQSTGPLALAASGVYKPSGRTTIVLNAATDQITIDGTPHPWPANGVIYVENDPVPPNPPCTGYDPARPQGSPTSCGDAYVRGTYDRPLTIATANDIVVNEDIINNAPGAGSDSLLGLVANNFVRVWHPVGNTPTIYNNSGSPLWGKCWSTPTAGALGNVRIDAAILALNNSFMVDAYDCGSSAQGTLTVNGAIAQRYRGPVGYASGGTVSAGYNKVYTYDDRFRVRNPPHFLPPDSATFNVVRVTQQKTAT
jgi:hypothetical protein